MTVLAGIAALLMATCLGYYLGRRVDSTPSPWRKRTSRIALGRLAINLLVVLAARRVRQSLLTGSARSDGAPLGLLWRGVARSRSW
jgi:hypothetical protein